MRTVMMLLLGFNLFGGQSLRALCVDGQFNNATWSAVKIKDTTVGAAATYHKQSD